jgi:hypothetical protein
VQGDGIWRFAGPGEEELQVVEVVDGSGGVGASAPQPPVEAFSLGLHNSTSC